jgi:hypothetical protein
MLEKETDFTPHRFAHEIPHPGLANFIKTWREPQRRWGCVATVVGSGAGIVGILYLFDKFK